MFFKTYRFFIIIFYLFILYILYLAGMEIWRNFHYPNTIPKKAAVCHETPQMYPQVATPHFQWRGGGVVTFWFDEAWRSQLVTAYPLLEQQGLKAAISVPTTWICSKPFLSWNELRYLQSQGWEIASEGKTNQCSLAESKVSYIAAELKGAKAILQSQGLNAGQFVMPCGIYRIYVADITKQYYNSFRTTVPGLNSLPVKNSFSLFAYSVDQTTTVAQVQAWLAAARQQRAWLIMAFHQIDKSGREGSISPAMFNKIIALVGASGLQVALPHQVLAITPLSP